MDGVRLKIERAAHHLDAIKREAAAFDHGPSLIPAEYDAQTDTHVFRAQHDAPSSTALSGPVGEFLYNLRCALDYIVHDLITLAGHTVERQAFPIYTKPDKYARAAPSMIRGVPPETEPLFEMLQPFYGPNSQPMHPSWRDPETEPLAVLHRLNNRDKHRTLTLIETVGEIEPQFRSERETFTRPAKMPLGQISRGSILAAFTPGSLPPREEVSLGVAYYMGIYEEGVPRGRDLVQTLDEILRVVRDTVAPTFSPYFPSA
jgi:hypothetical protein